jgi:hypothetical protein
MDAMRQNMTWDGWFHAATWIVTLVGAVQAPAASTRSTEIVGASPLATDAPGAATVGIVVSLPSALAPGLSWPVVPIVLCPVSAIHPLMVTRWPR